MMNKKEIRVWTGKHAMKLGYHSKVVKRAVKDGICTYKGSQYVVWEAPFSKELYINL